MASVFKRATSGKWQMAVIDRNGKQRMRSSGTLDHAAALRMANKWEADEALRRDGVIDSALEAICDSAKLPLESHLEHFENALRVAGNTDKHVALTLLRIRAICRLGAIRLTNELTAERVNRAAVILEREGIASEHKQHDHRPMSRATVNHYLTAIKAVAKWLTIHGKVAANPLLAIRKGNAKADRRRVRRMLLISEWAWLKSAAEAVGDRHGMSGRERCLLYATAIQTGLRSNELRSLTRARFYLDGSRPFIVCRADATKNGKEAKQYIRAELAAELAALIATKHPKAAVFALPHETDLAAMLRADLESARAAWLKAAPPADRLEREQSDFLLSENHDGAKLDFHSLRHSTGAWLAMAGVNPKVVQAIMRHSTITLTMDTYGHLFPGSEADAVDRLPDLCSSDAVSMQYSARNSMQSSASPSITAAAG